ncbi:MAG: protein kinase [Kiritimatiellaeota bacterium]|nr:protein kinase [Kiritimatiellota bacterium]
MLDFQCKFCENDIQAEYALIGEFVSCPICGEIVVVPDPLLVYGSDYNGYVIERLRATSLLWNTYQATPVNAELRGLEHVLLRIPTTFFLKRLTHFDKFCDVIVRSGSLGVKGIAPLVSSSLVPGRTYFVFEFFPSIDLSAFIAKTGPLDLINSLRVIRRCAVALRDAWSESGIIHQNILPHNVRINEQREIRMMNLGLSQLLLEDGDLLEEGFNIWDQRYISPEFALNGKGDTPACDIYALGMVFYFLLTGSHPYALVPEDRIPESPIPDLKSELPLIPYDAKAMFQLMVAKRLTLRFSDWNEVLERIDALLHKSRKRIDNNDFGQSYSKMKTRTDRRKPIALNPVIAVSTEKFRREREIQKPEMSETIAKPVDHNKKTRHIQVALRNTRCKKNFMTRHSGLIVALSVSSFLVFAFLVFWWSGERSREKTQNAPIEVSNESSPRVQVSEVNRKGESSHGRRTTRRRTSPMAMLDDHLKKALKYSREHPDDFDGALKRLEAVIPEAVNLDRFDIVNMIREKTDFIAARKASLMEDRARIVIKRIRKDIAPMFEAGDYEKALAFVNEYDGPMKTESLFARKRLMREIKGIADSKVQSRNKINAGIANLAEKLAPLLLNGEIAEAARVLRDYSTDTKRLSVLKSKWLNEIETYGGANGPTASPSDLPDTASILKMPLLARGLVFAAAGDYESAEKAFKELPTPAVKPFMDALNVKKLSEKRKLEEKRIVNEFAGILKSYSMNFDAAAPENLLLELAKAKISRQNAGKLASETTRFATENVESAFMKTHANLVDAVLLFCKRNSGTGKDVRIDIPSEISVSPKDNLASIVASAKSGSVIKLPATKFKIGRTVISSSNITISGARGTLLTGGPLVIKSRKCSLVNLSFKNLNVELVNASDGSLKNCSLDGGGIKIVKSNDCSIVNTLALTVLIDNSERLSVDHCTFASNDESVSPLRINTKTLDIRNSIIYGRGFALTFFRDHTNRKCKFENTLIFGEKGYCVRDRKTEFFKKRDIASTKSRIRRFIKTRNNIYDPPQFNNHLKGDWRLVPGTPGSKAATDGSDWGVPSSILAPSSND